MAATQKCCTQYFTFGSTTGYTVAEHLKIDRLPPYHLVEVFHSLLLKYCPKQQNFWYDRMQAHTELAILDHNYKRKQTITKSGIINYMHCTRFAFFLNTCKQAKN